MARPPWNPDNAPQELHNLVDAAAEAAAVADRAEALADQTATQAWEAIAKARAAGAPMDYLADKVGRPRATIYRHIGRPTRDG